MPDTATQTRDRRNSVNLPPPPGTMLTGALGAPPNMAPVAGVVTPPATLPAGALNQAPVAGVVTPPPTLPAGALNQLSLGGTGIPPLTLSSVPLGGLSSGGMTLPPLQPPGTQPSGGAAAGQTTGAGWRPVRPSAALLAAQQARQSAANTAANQAQQPAPAATASTPAQAGGTQAGGTQAGGTQAGGTQAGGTQAGGTQAGGTQAGGTQAGGTQAGGTQAGGTQAGGTQAGGTQQPATVTLNQEQKNRLTVIRKTLVGRKCMELGAHVSGGTLGGTWALEDRARNDPKYTGAQPQNQNQPQNAQPLRKRDKVGRFFQKIGKKVGGKVLDWGKDSVVDVGTPGLDIASGFVDYKGGGEDRSWLHVANKNPNEAEAWGDGEMQSEGIPIAGSVVKSIDCIVQAVKLGFKIKDYVGEHRAGGHTDTERWELFMEVVDTIQNLLDTAMSWAGSFTTALGQLPIVGAIIGAINAGIGLVEDAIRLGKAEHYIRHMRDQKAEAKTAIRDKQSAIGGGFGGEKDRRYGFMNLKTKKKFKVEQEYGDVAGAAPGRTRKKRLDEKTKELRGGAAQPGTSPEERESAVRALEDYDVTKEITQANLHRRQEGITKIILKDIIGFGTALAAIDPTGLGSAIGATVTAAINLGFLGEKIANTARQYFRETGKFGANENKSDANKLIRRHNLAVVMYDRIKELAETEVASIGGGGAGTAATATQQQASRLTSENQKKFELMDERIKAMGVSGPFLRSADAIEMVKAMRKGFYRDA